MKPKRRVWDLDTNDETKDNQERCECDGDSNNNARIEAENEDNNDAKLRAENNARKEAEKLVNIFWEEFDDKIRPEFFTYAWYPNASEELQLSSYIYCMLKKVFGGSRLFEREAVQDFIRLVWKFYHPNRFHNFLQGVLCMHFIYVTIKNNSQVWTGLEKIALLLSGLCQYISHPGFTIRNSTMELHHYKVTEMLVAKSGLFRNEPEHAKVIMEKVQALMMSIQHPTNAEIVSNISTAFTTTGKD
uniref:cAMP and cAMP-inhibited cGMP 3',5'-cyclic phosphodiesterase 10A n=1 Tax=Cacopsylla melanoneura TaxID=428564 RepID=A0A8D9B6H7_9HEMI